MSEIQAEAVALAQKGLHVLPLQPAEKRPAGHLVRHGHKDASSDPERVASWWQGQHDYNLGIACRASGLAVFDIDERNGGERPDCLPETLTVSTPGGQHLYYWVDDPDWMPVGKADEGIDLKWDGYVVAPPSVHPSGKMYATANEVAVQLLPDDIKDYLDQ